MKVRKVEIRADTIFGADGVHNPNEVNPYVGCMFHCTYCYVDGNPDPRRDLYVKVNASELVRRDIKGLDPEIAIFFSSRTDPYLYAERRYCITRRCIEEVVRHPGYRVSVLTKSDLVLRDLDLLRELPSKVQFTVATVDEDVRRVVEPHAPPVQRRLRAIAALERAGVPTGVRIKPVLPFDLTDVRAIVAAVEGISSGPIVVQGLSMNIEHTVRMAQLTQRAFPERLARWVNDMEAVHRERRSLVEFLIAHERVQYIPTEEVARDVARRFSR